MTSNAHCENEVVLTGLDGSNPLAFLAALGLLNLVKTHNPNENPLLSWKKMMGMWRPAFIGSRIKGESFCESLEMMLNSVDTTPFEIDDKLPFEVVKFRQNAVIHLRQGKSVNRRTLDMLSAFGSDICSNEQGIFQDTKLRMIRSGDSAGNGFCAYARTICAGTSAAHIQRTLFEDWDYCDEGTSLRLDPNEDRQYALRAGDPSKEATVSMRGANRLAIEGMTLMYTAPVGRHLKTTGFSELRRRSVYWTWPLWECPITVDTVKSVVSCPYLQEESINKRQILSMGISAVFRSRRVATSKYYNNLSPSFAVL